MDLAYTSVNESSNNLNYMHNLNLTGDDIQRISIIQSLPQLVQVNSTATFTRIIPKIQQDLPSSSSEIQLTTSRTFKTLLTTQSNQSLLNSVVQGLDCKDPYVAYSWCETLLSLIPSLPEEILKNTVLAMVQAKSTPNNSVSLKVFCAKILGKMSTIQKFKIIDAKKDILPLALSLCQDPTADVRATICISLPSVAQAIGNALVKSNLLPSLIELANDESAIVRGASIVAISQILKYLDAETKKQTMLPLIKQLCEKSMKNLDHITSLALSSEFGNILNGLHVIPAADIQYLLDVFRSFAQRGRGATQAGKGDASKEVSCREKCACQVLSVLEFVQKHSSKDLQVVYGICRELASDPCYLVRRSVAGNVAGMAQILGDQNKIMKNEVVRLLRDDAIEVLDLLVPNISGTLLSFCSNGTISNTVSNQVTIDIGRALFKCQTELSKGYNWRLTVGFLQQLESLPYCFPSEFIHNNFTPVLLDKIMVGNSKPIKIQAIRTLVIFLRYNFKPNQHKWLEDSLIKQIRESPKAYRRMLYVHLCDAVLDIYSEKYFKEHFLTQLLSLSTDKVVGIRYGFAMICPRIKGMVSLNADAKYRQMINDSISKFEIAEKTKFVIEAIKSNKKKEGPPRKLDEKLKEEEKRIADEASGTIKMPPTSTKETKPAVAATQGKPKFEPKVTESESVRSNPEMTFLEQHFYIDAGVTLPKDKVDSSTEDIANTETINETESIDMVRDVKSISEVVLEKLTTNITDDIKVNLRKISKYESKIVQPKIFSNQYDEIKINVKTKRYSSVISENYFDKDRKIHNRRSLNLPNRESSKIPICTKNKPGDTVFISKKSEMVSLKSLDLCDRSFPNKIDYETSSNYPETLKIKSPSNLPIFRRTSTGNTARPTRTSVARLK